MELWFLYACGSVFCSGLASFLQKISAKEGHHPKIVTLFSFAVALIVAPILWYSQGSPIDSWLVGMLAGGLGGMLYALSYILRIVSLRHVDTTIFFPLYKTLGPLLVLGIGLFYFKDTLAVYDYWGIGLGLVVPLMLLSRSEGKRQQNLKKGLTLLAITASIAAIAFAVAKIGIDTGVNLWLFVTAQAFIGMTFSFLISLPDIKKDKLLDVSLHKKAISTGLLIGLIDTFNIYFILMALSTGLVSVVYTVNSFYILIPIVLSVLIYKEHMNTKKALAIGFSILAVVFFQI